MKRRRILQIDHEYNKLSENGNISKALQQKKKVEKPDPPEANGVNAATYSPIPVFLPI